MDENETQIEEQIEINTAINVFLSNGEQIQGAYLGSVPVGGEFGCATVYLKIYEYTSNKVHFLNPDHILYFGFK